MVHPTVLANRSQGSLDQMGMIDAILRSGNLRRTVTAPEVRSNVLNASTGRDWTLAVPGTMIGGAAILPEDVRNAIVRELMQ